MASARPYAGMDCDDMKKRLDKAEQELLRELSLIADELKHRSMPAARRLQQQVTRITECFEACGQDKT